MANQDDRVVVVMVPLPAQGHLNQLLHLSRLITTSIYNIPVHYISFAIHVRQAKLRLQGWNPDSDNKITFHEFPAPTFISRQPDPNSSTKFPSHLQPLFDISFHLSEHVASFVHSLSPNFERIVVIHDSLMPQDVSKVYNAESYAFHSVSAFCTFLNIWDASGRPFPIDSEIVDDIPSLEGCFTLEFAGFVQKQHQHWKKSSGYLLNTSRVIEGTYLDLLAKEELRGRLKQWAIGPFNLFSIKDNGSVIPRHECLYWLDQQPQNSVLYIAFGTTTCFTDEQVQEVAEGLEQSGKRFIWVLRDADQADVFAGGERRVELPNGFEERMKERGIVVRDWAPQVMILEHPSTGGFLSHCGWNSCLESITMGVPILTWPMHSDQPRNALLITKLLKIGMVLKCWKKRDEVVRSDTVEQVVRRLMSSQEGDEITKRAKELGMVLKKSTEKGGVSNVELDAFLAQISR